MFKLVSGKYWQFVSQDNKTIIMIQEAKKRKVRLAVF